MCNQSWPGWLSEVGSAPFWSDFWPNFTATLAGVLVGIPVALWLSGNEARSQAKKRHREVEIRRSEVSELLRNALRANADELRRVHPILGTHETTTDLRLHLEVWRVLRADVMEVFASRELRADLAAHFEAVEKLEHEVREQVRRHLSALWTPENYQGRRAELIQSIESDIYTRAAERAAAEARIADELAGRL